jgi:hypothetical protein
MDTLEERCEPHSAVSWAAVIAGAVASVALGFVLLSFAAGFGMPIGSPWPTQNPALESFSPIEGATLIAAQVVCGAFGGYLAGRLRIKWLNVHGHEVHFRDTAHGLLAWALATIAGGVVAATAWTSHAVVPSATVSAELTSQYWLFMGIGLLLSAFTASVASAIGGMRRDEMHAHYWSTRTKV